MAKSNRNSADDWATQIRSAQRYKDKFGKAADWSTYKNYYRGEFAGYDRSNVYNLLPSNETFALARSMVPQIYFRNPYIMASPRQPMGQGKEIWAKMVEGMDNWLLQELDIKQVMKTAILDEFFTSRGIIKLGYDSEFGFNQTTPVGEEDVRAEYNVNVKKGMPFTERVDPDLWFVPYGSRVGTNMEWVDHLIIKHFEDAKRSPLYTIPDALKGTHVDKLLLSEAKQQVYDEFEGGEGGQANWLGIHEIRDARRGEVLALVMPDNTIIRKPEEDLLQIDGLPFVDFTFNEDPDFYWGPSTARIIEPQQLEINETRTQTMIHRKLAMLKFVYDNTRWTPTEMQKFLSEDIGIGAGVKGNPNEVIKEIIPSIPNDLAQWPEIIRGDMRAAVGQGRNQQADAIKPGGRTTATEAQIMQQAMTLRMDEKRDVMADVLTKVMRKVNQIVFKFWDKERVTEVVGFDGAKYWVKYTPQAIKGEYDLKVDVESMTPTTKALRRKDLVQIIQALSKNPNANLDYLMRMLAREFDWLDAMKVLPQAEENQKSGKPMEMNDFMQTQQKIMSDGDFRKGRVNKTLEGLGGVEGLVGGTEGLM